MIKYNSDYAEFLKIGRTPRLKFVARPAFNDYNATHGREWYIQAIPLHVFSVMDNLSGHHYALRLERSDENYDNPKDVYWTEYEAKAVCALLNGLQIGPVDEDRKIMEEVLEKHYTEQFQQGGTVELVDLAKEHVEKRKRKGKKR